MESLLQTVNVLMIHAACENVLTDAIKRLYPDFSLPSILLEVPPNLEFGELAASECFELAKHAKKKPRTIAEEKRQAGQIVEMEIFKQGIVKYVDVF